MEETNRVRTGTRKLEKKVWTGVSSRSPGQGKKKEVPPFYISDKLVLGLCARYNS